MTSYYRDLDPVVGRAATAKRRLKRLEELYGQQVPPFVQIERAVLTRESESPEIPRGEPVTPTVDVRERSVMFANRRGEVGDQNVVSESRRVGSRAPPSERNAGAGDDIEELGIRTWEERDRELRERAIDLEERGRNMVRDIPRRSEAPPERDTFDYPEAPEEY